MKSIELEKYKQFFSNVEKTIKEYTDISDEEKLATILLELENMIMYKRGGFSKEINNFIQNQRNRICKTSANDWQYVKDSELPEENIYVLIRLNDENTCYKYCTGFWEKEEKCFHTLFCDKVDTKDIIAWKEIIP